MGTPFYYFFFTIFTLNLFFGSHVYSVPYDHTYKLECVANPDAPLYNGGIVANPEFNEEMKGWTAAGVAKIEVAKSPEGNNYAVVSNVLTEISDGISQTFNVDRNQFYTVSAWIQVVGQAETRIHAQVKASTGNTTAGAVIPKTGCWTMLKGGFVVNVTESVELHFEALDKGIEFWVDSISVQPFTPEEWASHNAENLEKVRKTKVKIGVVDQNGKPVANAAVSIRQVKPNFPWGCILTERIINNPEAQKWFLERFTLTAFENDLKWESTERSKGVVNYTIPDAMTEFALSNGVAIRGHTIVWDTKQYKPSWMLEISNEELREAALKRVNSVVSRYKGKFIHWDVVNENMHYNMVSSVFPGKSADIFKLTHQIDPEPILFLNEFGVVEAPHIVGRAMPMVYTAKIKELRDGGYAGPLGIGLQCHHDQNDPNIPFVRASLDVFAATGLPVWITEFTVNDNLTNQLKSMKMLLNEYHSHPTVKGILIWSGVTPDGHCWSMCLTDQNNKNKPVGDVVDDFMHQFIRVADSNGTTDSNGVLEASLVHGEYEANVTLSNGAQSPASQTFNLVPDGNLTTVELKINL